VPKKDSKGRTAKAAKAAQAAQPAQGAKPAKAVRMTDLLRVPTGKVDLSTFDARSTPGAPGDRAATEAEFATTAPRVAELQQRLYAEGIGGGRRRVVLLLQGMDTSGKDGTVKHVVGQVNPQGVVIKSFKAPTRAERRHDFLWRIRLAVPPAGSLGIFNRSQYEDVLIVRVHNLVPQSEWETRYDRINAFEQELADDGVHLIKVFLHLSKEEQKARLIDRLDDPDKHWKYNPGDITERAFWGDYEQAYSAALERCNSAEAPWFVVPADRKWYRNWAVGRLLLETLEELAPQYPPADFDVVGERARAEQS
jgi:PPK2 family polyphosphate:nucleotide phosphotransferase